MSSLMDEILAVTAQESSQSTEPTTGDFVLDILVTAINERDVDFLGGHALKMYEHLFDLDMNFIYQTAYMKWYIEDTDVKVEDTRDLFKNHTKAATQHAKDIGLYMEGV
ncbi:hypothetical protein KAT92_05365 [Candidatus Babeliales bacterium]|nr:hypothetical protein [Candidatus Babeliales bacterium]